MRETVARSSHDGKSRCRLTPERWRRSILSVAVGPLLSTTLSLTVSSVLAVPPTPPSERIEFDSHIGPIFAENCVACHGPDKKSLKAGFRIDSRARALAPLRDGGHAIVPGDSRASVLLERVSSEDEDVRMPPPDAGERLKPTQIKLLERWIEQGAEYQ